MIRQVTDAFMAIFGLRRRGPLSVRCPLCHSAIGLACVTKGGVTCAPHLVRVRAGEGK